MVRCFLFSLFMGRVRIWRSLKNVRLVRNLQTCMPIYQHRNGLLARVLRHSLNKKNVCWQSGEVCNTTHCLKNITQKIYVGLCSSLWLNSYSWFSFNECYTDDIHILFYRCYLGSKINYVEGFLLLIHNNVVSCQYDSILFMAFKWSFDIKEDIWNTQLICKCKGRAFCSLQLGCEPICLCKITGKANLDLFCLLLYFCLNYYTC